MDFRPARLVLAALVLVAAGPALANWENTRWGLTEAEVQERFSDRSVSIDANGERHLDIAPLAHSDPRQTGVSLRFEGGRLARVEAAFNAPAATLQAEFARRLGPAGPDGRFCDRTAGETVAISGSGGTARVTWAPDPSGCSVAAPRPPMEPWTATQWGMTAQQVKALYPALKPGDASGTINFAYLDQRNFSFSGRVWTRVRFSFYRGGLEHIELFTPDPYPAVRAEVLARLGQAAVDWEMADQTSFNDPVVRSKISVGKAGAETMILLSEAR